MSVTATITPENARLNLRTAERNVRQRMGLSLNVDDDQIPYSLRVDFIRELAREVLKYPASFTPEMLAQAQSILGKTYDELSDSSFDVGALATATAIAAVPVLDATKWIVWGLLGIGVLWLVFNLLPRRAR